MNGYKSPESFIEAYPEWQQELERLRSLLLTTELTETIKWGMPGYTINGKNVVGLGAFKSYVGIWFHQGIFLKDKKKVLVNAQDGKTKAMRQWRFSSINEMDEELILEYVEEAIQNQKEGKEIKPAKDKKLILPKEMVEHLSKNGNIKSAFDKFTQGKKREFAEYISEAKREETKLKRLEKITPLILAGTGLNDKYK